MIFHDRQEAGGQLAAALQSYRAEPSVVLALPRGGVVVAARVARALKAPLDLLITRKIGHPFSPEYAIAAVAEDGQMFANQDELAQVDQRWLRERLEHEKNEIRRRRQKYLGGRLALPLSGKTAVIVDDGIATGLTIKAGIAYVKKQNPKEIVVAVPVAPAETVAELKKLVDKVLVLYAPTGGFGAVGNYYERFDQTSDEEVTNLLKSAA